MGQEIELKLAIPPEALRRLARHPLIASATRQGRAQTLFNTYFDTPALDLQQAGIALRTRRAGRALLQTIKCAGIVTGGLSTRPEWEQPFTGSFDFSVVSDDATRKLLHKHAGDIVPLFSTDFRRETRLARPRAGVEIALMVDTGSIRAGDREAPICELELELFAGSASDVLDFALALCADLPLLPTNASKAERGIRLHSGTRPQAKRARTSPVLVTQSPVEAFRSVAFDCLAIWQANAEGIRAAAGSQAEHDPAFVHQLRVALRRLRSLLRVFAPTLPAPFVDDWSDTLGDIADRVGAARDLDVLREAVLAPVANGGVDAFSTCFDAMHAQALQEARDALQEPAVGQTPLRLTRDLLALPEARPRALRHFAASALDRLARQAGKAHEAARTLEAPALHDLRIRYKRLRYGLECFAPLLPATATKRYLKKLTALLETLGYLNDIEVAALRLRDWAGDDAQLANARAYVLGWHGPRVQRLRGKLLSRSTALLEADAPWRSKKK